MKKLLFLAILPLSLTLTSCQYYWPISNSSGSGIQFQMPSDKYTVVGTADGESCSASWFGFSGLGMGGGGLPAGGRTSYQDAVKAAIKAKNGDHFIQITSDFKETSYIIYHEYCVYVYGQVLKLK